MSSAALRKMLETETDEVAKAWLELRIHEIEEEEEEE